jgi:hypothetical protein
LYQRFTHSYIRPDAYTAPNLNRFDCRELVLGHRAFWQPPAEPDADELFLAQRELTIASSRDTPNPRFEHDFQPALGRL